jgi:hypothetical protein
MAKSSTRAQLAREETIAETIVEAIAETTVSAATTTAVPATTTAVRVVTDLRATAPRVTVPRAIVPRVHVLLKKEAQTNVNA